MDMTTPIVTLSEDGLLMYLRLPYQMRELCNHIKNVTWDPYEKAWILPRTPENEEIVKSIAGIRMPLEMMDEIDVGIKWSEIGIEPIRPMPLVQGVVPYAHQVAGYNEALEIFESPGSGYALLFEQGTGKTLTAISVIGRLILEKKVKRVLIVAPVSVLSVWGNEIEKFLSFKFPVVSLYGTKPQKMKALKKFTDTTDEGAVIVNYESIWRDGLKEQMLKFKPDAVIADESQRIKSYKAKQSKFMWQLGAQASYNMCLSGTPVMNNPLDLWSQYKFMAPYVFDKSYFAFKTRHAIMGGFEGRVVLAYRDLSGLKKRAHSVALRVTKASALDLPEELPAQKLYCELEPAARRVYNQVKHEFASFIGDGKAVTGDKIITRLLRFSQITGGFVTATNLNEVSEITNISNAKLGLLKETLTDLLASTEKVVIFARFRAEIQAICKVCSELVGDGYELLWGDTPQKDRGDIIDSFQTNPETRLLVAQIQVGGTGITLTAANTMIFYSLDYSYGNHEQAKARIHRIGQKKPVTYIYLLAKDTIDEIVYEALEGKKSMADNIMDNIKSIIK